MERQMLLLFITGLLISSCGWNLNAPDNGNGGSDPGDEALHFLKM